jgi:hypothetical protein
MYTEVKKYGHCGYRALRVSLGWSDRSWRDSKRVLLKHWLKNQKCFLEIIGSDPNDTAKFDQITKGLQNLTIPCKKDCYMTLHCAGIFFTNNFASIIYNTKFYYNNRLFNC